MIERIGVIVPAHNEQDLLPACLESVLRSAAEVEVPVRVVVVLDRCTDQSRAVVHRYRAVQSVDLIAGNVGVARAAGAEAVLRWARWSPPNRVWLATTDADTTVPERWLRRQLDYADCGWDAFAGTVMVEDWAGHPLDVQRAWAESYNAVDGHDHVHGANLGCTGSAYLAAGGWPPLASDEDVALLAAMSERRVLRGAGNPVVTSARQQARASGGFGDTLCDLAG